MQKYANSTKYFAILAAVALGSGAYVWAQFGQVDPVDACASAYGAPYDASRGDKIEGACGHLTQEQKLKAISIAEKQVKADWR